MAIEGGLRGNLTAGMQLIARYKGQDHTAEVVIDEDGKARFRLSDGREFRSPSAAASAVMNGQAANGWRFWSLQGEMPATDAKPAPVKAGKGRKPKVTPEPTETMGSEKLEEMAAE